MPEELSGPQSIGPEAHGGEYGSYTKDQAENWLHKQICSGAMTPEEGQKGIATDWRQYIPQVLSSNCDGAHGDGRQREYVTAPAGGRNEFPGERRAPSRYLAVAFVTDKGPNLRARCFNCEAPITAYSATLTTDPIGWIHWDNSNHLYALSASKLYVFTVTPTSITPASGSPYSIASPNGLFVVPK